MNNKPWYQSVTMWGIFLTAAATLLTKYPDLASFIGSESTAQAFATLGQGFGLIMSAWGRVRATKELSR